MKTKEYPNRQNEILEKLNKQSKEEKELSKFRFNYFMYSDSINKWQAVIIGIFVALSTSFLIFFLQGGYIKELLDSKIIIGMILGFIIAIFIISCYKLIMAMIKKCRAGDKIRNIEKTC